MIQTSHTVLKEKQPVAVPETLVSLLGIRNKFLFVYKLTFSASPALPSCKNILPMLPFLWPQGMVLLKTL